MAPLSHFQIQWNITVLGSTASALSTNLLYLSKLEWVSVPCSHTVLRYYNPILSLVRSVPRVPKMTQPELFVRVNEAYIIELCDSARFPRL